MKRFVAALSILFWLTAIPAASQNKHIHDSDCGHDHSKGFHLHGRNEFGLSGGAMYSLDHKTWGRGIHFHYYRTLSPVSRWSVGGFAEAAWVEGFHTSMGAGVKFQPLERLSLGLMPGLTIARHDHDHGHQLHTHTGEHNHGNDVKANFSLHAEIVYDLFHFSDFHLGPAIDYSWSKKDSHLMLGVHFAYSF